MLDNNHLSVKFIENNSSWSVSCFFFNFINGGFCCTEATNYKVVTFIELQFYDLCLHVLLKKFFCP